MEKFRFMTNYIKTEYLGGIFLVLVNFSSKGDSVKLSGYHIYPCLLAVWAQSTFLSMIIRNSLVDARKQILLLLLLL